LISYVCSDLHWWHRLSVGVNENKHLHVPLHDTFAVSRVITSKHKCCCLLALAHVKKFPGHSGIPGNEEADRQANLARDVSGNTVIERPFTSASNKARRISEGRSAAKAKWEADKCSKHFSYRPKGKTGTKRPVPMTSVKSLATRFYRLKCGHAPTGVYLKQFGHREDDKCWRCEGTAAQTWEHLFCHCSRWRDQQKALWKAVGKVTGWKAGRCRHVQVSKLLSMEEYDQAVVDFLVATEVGKFPPK